MNADIVLWRKQCLHSFFFSQRDGHAKAAYAVGMPITNRPCADAVRVYVSDCFGRVMAIEK